MAFCCKRARVDAAHDAPALRGAAGPDAADGGVSLGELPPELLQGVVQHLPRLQWPAARLVSTGFEAAVACLITSLTVRRWPSGGGDDNSSSGKATIQLSSSSSLARVAQLDAAADTPADWQQLAALAAQLPRLRHLRCHGLAPLHLAPPGDAAAALGRLTRLELPESSSGGLPAGAQLPGLRRLLLYRADGVQRLAAFAPNLARLDCLFMRMEQQQGPAGRAAGDGGNEGGNSGVRCSLEACAALCVQCVEASTAAEVLQGLSAAFPRLTSLLSFPHLELLQQPAAAAHESAGRPVAQLTLCQLLEALPSLSSVRDTAGNLRLCGGPLRPEARRALGQLRHLSAAYYTAAGADAGAACAAAPAGGDLCRNLRHMTQLRELRLATDVGAGGAGGAPLLRALAALPHLQTAALPSALLCNECCSGAHAALALLAVGSSSSALRSLEFGHVGRGSLAGMRHCGWLGSMPCQHAGSMVAGRQLLQDVAAAAAAGRREGALRVCFSAAELRL